MGTNRLGGSALALTAALIASSCSAGDQVELAETHTVTLDAADVAEATVREIRSGVVITGTLDPWRRAEVKAQVAGTATGVRVDQGDPVTRGLPLLTLEAEGIMSQAASADATVAAAQANLAQAERQLASARTLHEAGAMSDLDFQAASTAFEAAQAQLASARAQAAGASEQARRTVVRAPFTGEISEKQVNEGEAVSSGETLFTLVNSSSLELQGHVPVAQAIRVREGQTVEFTLDAYPGQTFSGSVSRVSPVADPGTRQVGVTMRLANDDRRLIGGLFATGRVITGMASDAVVVPAAAVRGTNGGRHVWVVADGILVRRLVSVGERDEVAGLVSILAGVEAGEIVVVAPGDATEGTRVRVGDEMSLANAAGRGEGAVR